MFHAEKDTHEEEDMERQKRQGAEYEFYGKLPLKKAIPLGLQHVLAMFVGNLTPILIISGACGIAGEEFGSLQVDLLQNAMLIAGIVTLIQLFAIGPVGGKVPIIMGTSSGFIGVFNSVVQVMGGGILAYGAIMCASVIGGLFEGILGFLLKPLRRFFPAVVTGTVVLSIGLSLIAVGVNSFGGGNTANDFGSVENLLLGAAVLLIIVAVKHWMKGMASASSILIGIVAGYIIAAIMGLVLPTTAVNADGVEYTKAWVLNWDKVANAAWFSVPKLMPVKLVFDWRAIIPVLIMFVVTAVETVGDISGVMEGGMGREATDKELSGGVICDGIGSSLAALFGVLPNTSFSQNVGLVTMTGVINRFTILMGALILILASLFPPLGAFFNSLPQAVLGGCTVMMFGSIMYEGIKMLKECKFDDRTMIIVSLSFAIGVGLTQTSGNFFSAFPSEVGDIFNGNAVAGVFVVSLLLSLILPKHKEEA